MSSCLPATAVGAGELAQIWPLCCRSQKVYRTHAPHGRHVTTTTVRARRKKRTLLTPTSRGRRDRSRLTGHSPLYSVAAGAPVPLAHPRLLALKSHHLGHNWPFDLFSPHTDRPRTHLLSTQLCSEGLPFSRYPAHKLSPPSLAKS
jgi:hypothetical protein